MIMVESKGYDQTIEYLPTIEVYAKYAEVFSVREHLKCSKSRWLKEVDLYEWE